MFLLSCKTSESTSTAVKPQWVSAKPINSSYYIGISSAPKRGYNPNAYMATAKQNAMSDLASEISVNVESNSVLNSMQIDQNYSQQFINDIKMNNALQLEGFELVDTYEDENNYWVYYQLNKVTYQQWKEQKKQQAISSAKTKLLQAEKMLNDKLYYNAFQFYINTLEIISSYLNENTSCELENRQVDLGNYTYETIVDFLNNTKIVVNNKTVYVKKGVELSDEDFCYYVNDKENNPMASMPVKIAFTGNGLLKTSVKTNNDGKFCCTFQKIKSNNSQEILTLSTDVITLSRVATDQLVRNIIKSIPIAETKLNVVLQKPTLQITTEIKGLYTEDFLSSYISQNLSNTFDISTSSSTDFTLSVVSTTQKKNQYNGQYYIDLECTFVLNDASGQQLYRKRVKNEYSAKSEQEAAKNGYQELINSFDRSIKKEIEAVINN